MSESDDWKALHGRLGDEFKASTMYKMRLNTPVQLDLDLLPESRRSGMPVLGERLLSGNWQVGTESIDLSEGETPWNRPLPGRHFADRVHRFHFLKHLVTIGPEGVALARSLIDGWAEEYGRLNGFVWRVPVTIDRVWNWLEAGRYVLNKRLSDDEVLDALGKQIRHVQGSVKECPDSRQRLRGAVLLVLVAVLTDDGDKRLVSDEAFLEKELAAQILPDGGHVSRNPEALLSALIDLQFLEAAYEASGRVPSAAVTKALSRMGGMLGFLRLGDGRLPVMNGGFEVPIRDVERAFAPFEGGRAFSFATKSGFQRLIAGDLKLVMDAGAAPEAQFAASAHSGVMGFDLTDGPARLVSSCADHPDLAPSWRLLTRDTIAHSTLSLREENISTTTEYGATGVEVPSGPEGVTARRLEEGDEIWIDAQHNGWRSRHGLIHRRRLFMAGDGSRLTGEDSLSRPVSEAPSEEDTPIGFSVRFHFHPSVRFFRDGGNIGLRTAHGRRWVFKTSCEDREIDRTVYLGRGGREKSWQFCLYGKAMPNGDGTESTNRIKWAFIRTDLN